MKTASEKHIYTVREITRNIRSILESKFSAIWIEGEVSNFTRHQSGHMYFSIKDNESVLSCVLFRSVNAKLKFEIHGGMHVLCFGRISVYNKRGQYQLYVDKIEPRGAGALQIAFEQLKEKLMKEGLFDESRKRPLPYLPQRVGVVTSPTGAAIRDILNVAKRRFSNIEIVLNPVKVQGEGAKEEIADAIKLFNMLGNVDVIIIGRGGGSLEDLWAFNEEAVARAAHASEIPVVSAVGHEIDWTISDFVSDFRAPTPSAAAELLIPKKEDLVAAVAGYAARMRSALLFKTEALGDKLESLKNRYVLKEPMNVIIQREQEIDELAGGLALKTNFIVKLKTGSLKTLEGKLQALSPLNILARGYSITMKEDGTIVKVAGRLAKNEKIRTKVAKGEVVSRVERVD